MESVNCTVPVTGRSLSAGQLKPWQETIAKQLMLNSLDSGISVTTLADACALSRSHFTRKFKESTHVPPQEWLRQQRVQKSKELLSCSTMLLAEIAVECGFYDQSHFCRVFMRAEGMTPYAWQQRNRTTA